MNGTPSGGKTQSPGLSFRAQSSFVCFHGRNESADSFRGVTWRVEQAGHATGVRHVLLAVLCAAGDRQHLGRGKRGGDSKEGTLNIIQFSSHFLLKFRAKKITKNYLNKKMNKSSENQNIKDTLIVDFC